MRKLKELKYAITLEKKLTKDQILEGYLNLVYYGDRAYGVEAAAQHYFSVHGGQAEPLAGSAARRSDAEPRHDRPGELPEEGRRPPQRRARPHARARPDHRQAVARREEAHAQAGHARARSPRARASPRPTPTGATSSSTTPWRCPQLGKTRRGAQAHALPRRRHDHDHPRPRVQQVTQQEITKKVPIGDHVQQSAPPPTSPTPTTGKVLAFAQNTTYTVDKESSGKTGINWALDKQLRRFGRLPVRLDGQGVRPRDGHGVRHDAAGERQRQGGRRRSHGGLPAEGLARRLRTGRVSGTSTTTRSSPAAASAS